METSLEGFADRLEVTRWRAVLRASGSLRLPAFRGALWHSVVGAALKRLVCTVPPGLCEPCPRQNACPYPALFEARAGATGGPFPPGARIPNALWFDPGGWRAETVEPGRTFAIAYAVAGRAELASLVDEAIRRAAAAGLGRGRVTAAVERVESQSAPVGAAARRAVALAQGGLALELRSPLRLKRGGTYLKALDPVALARDLAFRLAALGHYHQGLPWPAPWRAALEEAAAVRVTDARTRWVESARYSARQGRRIVMGGLMGRVRLEGVGPALAALLGAGTVIHAGKGASVGLGEYRVLAGAATGGEG
ncbi:MAG TPA: CRISPR system precrRNA processing endoribonuclease RAMP protein Cas6 [Thermodesulfobacteriota bacterium]|nr:CRISPR system precrRNA processing endoribonuclease RAMP protein Cas6 [Thermodesulfobacteriota bacterium]